LLSATARILRASLLDFYFPGTFNRSVFPDAGMTTPKQLTYKLERYARQASRDATDNL
jgi:hypothetical protein